MENVYILKMDDWMSVQFWSCFFQFVWRIFAKTELQNCSFFQCPAPIAECFFLRNMSVLVKMRPPRKPCIFYLFFSCFFDVCFIHFSCFRITVATFAFTSFQKSWMTCDAWLTWDQWMSEWTWWVNDMWSVDDMWSLDEWMTCDQWMSEWMWWVNDMWAINDMWCVNEWHVMSEWNVNVI